MQLGLTLSLFVFSVCFAPAVWADSPAAAKTWRVVGELTEAERQLFDPRTDTPRDPERPYMPAERYPFQPPYTAEEMGYRAMEFSHSPRWSCNFVDVSGALTAHGYLITDKMHSPIFYVPNAKGHAGLRRRALRNETR